MKRQCARCNAEFVISEQEIKLLKESGSPLPVYCPSCRRQERRLKNDMLPVRRMGGFLVRRTPGSPRGHRRPGSGVGALGKMFSGRFFFVPILMLVIFSMAIGKRMEKNYHDPSQAVSGSAGGWSSGMQSGSDAQVQESFNPAGDTFIFKNFDAFTENYKKYGKAMGYDSEESYLAAANELIRNAASVEKDQETGETRYTDEERKKEAVVGRDGYLLWFRERPDMG